MRIQEPAVDVLEDFLAVPLLDTVLAVHWTQSQIETKDGNVAIRWSMRYEGSRLIYSPSDLIRYLNSPFASSVDRYRLKCMARNGFEGSSRIS